MPLAPFSRRPRQTEYILLREVSSSSSAFDTGEREYAMATTEDDSKPRLSSGDSKHEAEDEIRSSDGEREGGQGIFELAPDSALPEGTVDPVYERKARVLNAAVSLLTTARCTVRIRWGGVRAD